MIAIAEFEPPQNRVAAIGLPLFVFDDREHSTRLDPDNPVFGRELRPRLGQKDALPVIAEREALHFRAILQDLAAFGFDNLPVS